jgi:hypothetical protein
MIQMPDYVPGHTTDDELDSVDEILEDDDPVC